MGHTQAGPQGMARARSTERKESQPMGTMNDDLCRPWSRYQWASVTPIPEIDEPAGWNLSQWVGDQGNGAARRPSELPCPPETAGGLSGFGHVPGAAARWVPAR